MAGPCVQFVIVDIVPHRSRCGCRRRWLPTAALLLVCAGSLATPVGAEQSARAVIDGRGPGWVALTENDFTDVNCDAETWTWKDGTLHCTGKPVGVIRSKRRYENFELVCQWCHRQYAGNSGIFVWATDASIDELARAGEPGLPHGIEAQILDLGYAEAYTKKNKKPSDWFTSHGDVFPCGEAKMTPFPPVAPVGNRSFPSQNLTKGVDQWNHYYLRCINGEVRLWVNGTEVSGGTACDPKVGYLCLESEGAPIDFKDLRIRVLP